MSRPPNEQQGNKAEAEARTDQDSENVSRTELIVGFFALGVILVIVFVWFLAEPRQRASSQGVAGGAEATPCESDPFIVHYMQEGAQHLADLDIAKRSVQHYLQQVGDNPNLFYDSRWVSETFFWLAVMQTFQDQVNAMAVPARMEATHSQLTLAADYYVRFADAVITGIHDLDANAMARARPLLYRAAEAVVRSERLWNEACG